MAHDGRRADSPRSPPASLASMGSSELTPTLAVLHSNTLPEVEVDSVATADELRERLQGLAVALEELPEQSEGLRSAKDRSHAFVGDGTSATANGATGDGIKLATDAQSPAAAAAVVSDTTATATKCEPISEPELQQEIPTATGLRKVRIIYSDKFLEHKCPRRGHPECPERLKVCVDALRKDARLTDVIEWVEPTPIEPGSARRDLVMECVKQVHTYPDYLEDLERLSERGGFIDGDTYVAKNSFEIALLAVSAWLDAVDYALDDDDGGPAWALVRPPGHHATHVTGMGFCLLSNAAIAAHYALRKVGRVGILDFDVHHGNGTEAIVKTEPRIRFTSSHQYPLFPLTGLPSFVGPHGTILNIALSEGDGMDAYRSVFNEQMLPHILDCKEGEDPVGLVIVSAGYDALDVDPLANLNFKPEDYEELSRSIMRATQAAANHERVVFGLEGGYNLDSNGISAAICRTLHGLTEVPLE